MILSSQSLFLSIALFFVFFPSPSRGWQHHSVNFPSMKISSSLQPQSSPQFMSVSTLRVPSLRLNTFKSLRFSLLFAKPPTESSDSLFLNSSSFTNIRSPNQENANGNLNTNQALLDYLPDKGTHLPPKLSQLVVRATQQHLYGGGLTGENPPVSWPDILHVLETEFRVRRRIQVTLLVSEEEEEEEKEILSSHSLELVSLLSLAALYQLPKEITWQLLRPLLPFEEDEKFISYFSRIGWKGVRFPKGLAVRPRSQYGRQRRYPSRWKRPRAAQKLCQTAAQCQAPAPINRTQFLLSLSTSSPNPPIAPTPRSNLVYFPRQRRRLWRMIRRNFRRQTTRLRQYGRAGVLSYCTLNFLWYTIGMMWQWQRQQQVVAASTIDVSAILCLRQYLKSFVYVFAAAQVVKFAKMALAVAMAPTWKRVLQQIQTRLRISERSAMMTLVMSMLVIWVILTGGPPLVLALRSTTKRSLMYGPPTGLELGV